MANAGAITRSFKKELLLAGHAFHATGVPARGAGVADTFKAALFTPAGNVSAATATYAGATGELVHANYPPAGNDVAWLAPAADPANNVAHTTPSGPINFTAIAGVVDCVLFYNSTQGGKTVASYLFAAQTLNGNFTLTMPPPVSATALLQIS